MKTTLLMLSAIFLINLASTAQVGIGQTPKPGSILDLSNTSNKYLILPISSSEPTSILMTDTASIFYYKGNIYLKTPGEIKVFTPWKWDGDSTHAISSPIDAPVGIGVVPSSSNYRLQVADAGEVLSDLAGNAAIIAGNPLSNHLLIDNDEIMVKTNSNTAGVLKLQEESGTVEIRMDTLASSKTALKVNGSIDAAGSGSIKENGFDLVPPGTIVMWFGTVNASGNPLISGVANTNWHICDGAMGTPDLREMFVVGAGGDNPAVPGTGYAVGDDGGANSVALGTGEMPVHNHGGATGTGGAHDHGGSTGSDGRNTGDVDVATDCWAICSKEGVSDNTGSHSHTIPNQVAHSHTISNNGSGNAHENRPPYFALIYIMKL